MLHDLGHLLRALTGASRSAFEAESVRQCSTFLYSQIILTKLMKIVTINGTEQQAVFLVENVGGSEKSRLCCR